MTYFRYVRHADVERYLKRGWVEANTLLHTHHGRHAILMRWTGQGDPS
jgi:hypothetical protein